MEVRDVRQCGERIPHAYYIFERLFFNSPVVYEQPHCNSTMVLLENAIVATVAIVL